MLGHTTRAGHGDDTAVAVRAQHRGSGSGHQALDRSAYEAGNDLDRLPIRDCFEHRDLDIPICPARMAALFRPKE
jgi:hypothetical protein